jgi:uncharacterized protein YndB with AHSA1/START domain
VAVSIQRPVHEVYRFASNPENLPQWAHGLARSVTRVGDEWILETPDGPMSIEFAPGNDFGVLDHIVGVAPGVEVRNPMRVVPNGSGSEVTFTLIRQPDVGDEAFAQDAATVERDLQTLKAVLEAG